MRFKLEFDCDNAAFDEDSVHEATRTLARVVGTLALDGRWGSGFVRDSNGNTIGTWTFVEEPKPSVPQAAAYIRYRKACEAENLEHHSLSQWIVHGQPSGPLG